MEELLQTDEIGFIQWFWNTILRWESVAYSVIGNCTGLQFCGPELDKWQGETEKVEDHFSVSVQSQLVCRY